MSSLNAELAQRLSQRRQTAAAATVGGGEEGSKESSSKYCNFCGLEMEGNTVECISCGRGYHVKCLTRTQASRFKGRGWLCEDCMHVTPGGAAEEAGDGGANLRI